MPRGQALVSYIEWEGFEHKWKNDTLEPSESLPQGAEKAEVWCNENYELKANISGTIEGSHIDIHPEVEVGALIPLFEIKGSDEYGFWEYELGSCAVGDVLSSEWRDHLGDPPIIDYEAELFSSGAWWIARRYNRRIGEEDPVLAHLPARVDAALPRKLSDPYLTNVKLLSILVNIVSSSHHVYCGM